jgi:hypothetical protein
MRLLPLAALRRDREQEEMNNIEHKLRVKGSNVR